MSVKKLEQYLNDHHIKYEMIKHSPAYTAQEIAAKAHIPGQELAKTVIIKVDGQMAMAVLPATFQVDLSLLAQILAAEHVELASEAEFRDLFPDCETGAMPPFGNLYNLDVYVAEALSYDEQIAFNAGSHAQLIKLAYKDFETLVHPVVVHFEAEPT